MGTESFWESLRLDFMRLREECVINPPLLKGLQMRAISTAAPEGANWSFNCQNGPDGTGVARKFRWYAESAAVRLGFHGDSEACFYHWLEALKNNAPESHLRRSGGGPKDEWEMIEMLDVCGLSADHCRKCEAEETRVAPEAGNERNQSNLDTSRSQITAEGEPPSTAEQVISRHHQQLGSSSGNLRFPPYWNSPTPLFYFETWPLQTLGSDQKNEIKRGLLNVHAAFLEGRHGDIPQFDCWQWAYTIFAEQFRAAGQLTEDLLSKIIPTMVADASATGRWAQNQPSRPIKCDEHQIEFGNEFYDQVFLDLFRKVLQGRVFTWTGLLLTGKSDESADLLRTHHRRESTSFGGSDVATGATKTHSAARKSRRAGRYQRIDDALRDIAEARPSGHEEVFKALDGRAPLPSARPFKTARAWHAGFLANRTSARAWLSKQWTRLNLPPFQRGPK
jgi:hypothetical protein